MPVKRSVLFGSLVAEGSRYQVGQAYAAQLRQKDVYKRQVPARGRRLDAG